MGDLYWALYWAYSTGLLQHYGRRRLLYRCQILGISGLLVFRLSPSPPALSLAFLKRFRSLAGRASNSLPFLLIFPTVKISRMNKTARIDIPSSSSSPAPASAADGELNEDDIFSIDISHAPKHSPSSSPSQHPPARQLQRTKSGLKNVEASGILAALPEPSGNSYLNHVFHHKPAAALSTSVSSTASSTSSSSSARIIPSAPKPPQERVPFTASSLGKYPQSAPLQVPLAMRSRHKKEFKLTDVVVDEEEEEDEGERLPPHEIVARSLAQSSLLSCSVLEGAGRTLKGRDLRQVRNAVFRKTGFID